MDWTDILYFIDEAVRPEKMPTRRALDALDNLKHQIEVRIVALREEMGGPENAACEIGVMHRAPIRN